MRVLVLARSYPNPVLPTLGLWTERSMLALVDRCDVQVISPVPYCPPLPPLDRFRMYSRFRRIPRAVERGGVRVHHPRFLVGPGASLHAFEVDAYALAIRGLARRLWRDPGFDLVHANFIYPDGAVAHRLSESFDVPFVVTELAPWSPAWLGRRYVRDRAVPAARAAASILALSSYVARTIREYAGEDARVRVVPPPVDGDEFRLASAERSADQILFVGFPNYNKGVDVLLGAMARLRDRGAPGRLQIVGGAHYRSAVGEEIGLRTLAEKLELGDRVVFLGPQLPGQVAELMRQSSVVVLPSRAEAFGAVLAEALACGTPVVASRSGGPEDIVTDDVGVLVPVGDAEALADALSEVLRRRSAFAPELLRAFALTRFGTPVVADQIYDAYCRALDRSAPASGQAARARSGVPV